MRQLEERLPAGERWRVHDLVFVSIIGSPRDLGNASNAFTARVRAAAPPETVRLHDCRYACASFLSCQKVDARLMMEILDRADVDTALKLYGHALPDAKREVLNPKSRALGRGVVAG